MLSCSVALFSPFIWRLSRVLKRVFVLCGDYNKAILKRVDVKCLLQSPYNAGYGHFGGGHYGPNPAYDGKMTMGKERSWKINEKTFT